jgi:hypothetical protein
VAVAAAGDPPMSGALRLLRLTASWRPLAVVVAEAGPPAIPPALVAVPVATVAPVEAGPPAGLVRPPITATRTALPGYQDHLGPALAQLEAW